MFWLCNKIRIQNVLKIVYLHCCPTWRLWLLLILSWSEWPIMILTISKLLFYPHQWILVHKLMSAHKAGFCIFLGLLSLEVLSDLKLLRTVLLYHLPSFSRNKVLQLNLATINYIHSWTVTTSNTGHASHVHQFMGRIGCRHESWGADFHLLVADAGLCKQYLMPCEDSPNLWSL